MTMRLISYNIRKGGVGREGSLAAVIRECDPDLVVLQEATHAAVVERLSADTGLRFWGARDKYSLGYLSRVEVKGHRWHELREMRRAFLEIRLAGITIFGVHLSAVHSNVTERRRIRELRAMLKCVEEHCHGLHILAGDFNTLAPGEELDLRKLPPRLRVITWITGGKVRYETIQMMLDAGYVDGYRSLHYDKGFTFPTWDPHVRLDFFFLPAQSAERLKTCNVMNGAATVREASDHFPLFAEIETDQ